MCKKMRNFVFKFNFYLKNLTNFHETCRNADKMHGKFYELQMLVVNKFLLCIAKSITFFFNFIMRKTALKSNLCKIPLKRN